MNFKINSPAKINLGLKVLNKRKDNFHNIETIFQFLDWGDQISIENNVMESEIICKGVHQRENIIYKLLQILKNETGFKEKLKISIDKKIPAKSGLGGASSNAASILLALNKIYNLRLNKKNLFNIALSLGSDVPVFVHGKSCQATGRGEIFENITLEEKPILIILPDSKISTQEAFEKNKNFCASGIHKKVFFNSFENWARKNFNEINKSFEWIEQYNDAYLSGTGSTIYSLFNNFDEASKIMDNAPSNMNCFVTTTLNNSKIINDIELWGVAKR